VASTAQLLQTKTKRKTASPLALWHLLSFDAPTVAALWTWFLARANHIRLPLPSSAAMALAVWMLYAADRLLDTRLLDATPLTSPIAEMEARHLFHYRHRSAFLAGIALAAIILAVLLPHLETAAIHLYLTEGALLFAWFLILHATRSAHRLPKEIAVGLFFAAAVFIPTIARNPGLRLALLPDAILFAALCSLNCLFIYAWEHPPTSRATAQTTHATTRLALRHLTALAITVAIAGAAIALFYPSSPRPIAAACTLSTLLLIALDRTRTHLPAITLRASADLALLTPLALLPFIR
jgi:hypothetical protein